MNRTRIQVMLCGGTGCESTGSLKVKTALEAEIEKHGLEPEVEIVVTGCNGFCAVGPVMVVQPEEIFYQRVQPEDAAELVEEHFLKGRPVKRLFYKEPASKDVIPRMSDIRFFSSQVFIAMRNKGHIDPENIDEYIGTEGYFATVKALQEMTPDDIVSEVLDSGLRGRGGAGFPAGRKWSFAKAAEGDEKYVLCNADEGDPGAFMDRSILESDPHAVLEGMIIAAKAIGAQKGYIYCRSEYPLAIKRLYIAIDQAKNYGLLGQDILGSGFSFDIEVYEGAGAFVCGEETALMRSIEGRRGMPRPRPPFPANKGLWEKPTILNNVETFVNVPRIILNGSQWYAGIGTEKSKGTKVFALSGDVANIGLLEVPMGTTLREIIFDIGGGIPGKGRKFKAVQLGGPSGGCVPEAYLDTPVDFEEIAKVGAIMGSGGVIVMDSRTCMVDMARYFMDFIQEESCGKCTPCREGTKEILAILERICKGEGQKSDITRLETLAEVVGKTSLCGLGQTAPNPLLSTLKYFRDEYAAHIEEKRCPAKVCVDLIKFEVDPDKCTKCGMCYRHCPAEAISWKKKEVAVIHKDKCIKCMTCLEKCKFDAIY